MDWLEAKLAVSCGRFVRFRSSSDKLPLKGGVELTVPIGKEVACDRPGGVELVLLSPVNAVFALACSAAISDMCGSVPPARGAFFTGFVSLMWTVCCG